jgi:hypothetical protein
MHIDEFREFQRQGATHDVFSLVMTCRRKFLNAAQLLELRSDAYFSPSWTVDFSLIVDGDFSVIVDGVSV